MTGGRGRRIVLCDLLVSTPKTCWDVGGGAASDGEPRSCSVPPTPEAARRYVYPPTDAGLSGGRACASTGASIRTGGRGGSGSGGGSAARAGGCLTAHAGCGSESSGSPLRSSNEMPGDGTGGAGGRRTSCCRRCRSAALPRSACWRISSTRRCWSCHLSVARARPGA